MMEQDFYLIIFFLQAYLNYCLSLNIHKNIRIILLKHMLGF